MKYRSDEDRLVQSAAAVCAALGDAGRLSILVRLIDGEQTVGDLAQSVGAEISTLSQRLRLLRMHGLVRGRRDGRSVFYRLADEHIVELLEAVFAHASEPAALFLLRKDRLSEHRTHDEHEHEHGGDCSHVAVKHGVHVDYLHDGHLHHVHDGHIDEHALEISSANPATCVAHACSGHDKEHRHGARCGHEAVPHGDHVDYLVAGHIHHPHAEHCDDHGVLAVA